MARRSAAGSSSLGASAEPSIEQNEEQGRLAAARTAQEVVDVSSWARWSKEDRRDFDTMMELSHERRNLRQQGSS